MTEDTFKVEIGQRIQDVRKNKKMSVNELANKLNIKPRTLSSYERGEALPSIAFVTNFISTFKLSANWMLFGVGSMYKQDDFLQELKEIYSLSDKKMNALKELLDSPEIIKILFIFIATLKGDKDALETLKMINRSPSILKVMCAE